MKRLIFTLLLLSSSISLTFAGGIVTNTNQSGAWVRSMARSASVDVDAVFYNPAGTTHLEEGLHIQLNSQTISQKRTITNDLASLNMNEYEGDILTPVLPTLFVAYKTGDWTISGGFVIIGGGGSADYADGLPSFESEISTLPGALNDALGPVSAASGVDLNVSGYSADITFNGSSVYYGGQAGVAYKVNDMLSLAAGVRYVSISNSYEGHIKDISVMTAAGTSRADAWLNGTAIPTVTGVINNVNGIIGIPASLTPAIDAGLGGATLAQLVSAEQLTQDQADAITAGVAVIGQDASMMTLNEIKGAVEVATPTLQQRVDQLTAGRTELEARSAALGDKNVDVKQTGTGITPYFGADLSLMEGRLGIGLKYELATKITVENETTEDGTGLFPDGAETDNDIPSMLTVGVRFDATEELELQGSFIYYGDKSASYGKRDASGNPVDNGTTVTIGDFTGPYIAANSYELAFGGSYALNEGAGVSAGVLYTNTSANDIYQTDLSFTQPTFSVGLGGWYQINDMMKLELGLFTTRYEDITKVTTVTETFDKSIIGGGLGLSFNLSGN